MSDGVNGRLRSGLLEDATSSLLGTEEPENGEAFEDVENTRRLPARPGPGSARGPTTAGANLFASGLSARVERLGETVSRLINDSRAGSVGGAFRCSFLRELKLSNVIVTFRIMSSDTFPFLGFIYSSRSRVSFEKPGLVRILKLYKLKLSLFCPIDRWH